MASVFEFYFPDKDGNVKPPRCLDDPGWKPGDPVIDVSKIPPDVVRSLARTLYEDIKEYYSHPENVAKYEEWKRKQEAGIVEEKPSLAEIHARNEARRKAQVQSEKEKRYEDALFIREARELKGFTQQEVAKRAGITLDYYRSLENGNRKLTDIKFTTAFSVCNILGLDPSVVTAEGLKST